MIPAVIEEVLRFESPGPHAARYVTRDVEVQGVKIPKGSSVDFLIGAANRDHRRFVDGDRFDVKRQARRSEEHTSELQSLMRISYAVFCLKKKKTLHPNNTNQ